MASARVSQSFRKYHRWLGFFLAGIMAVYAISGILLIFRTTDFLKYEKTTTHSLAPALSATQLEQTLKIKGFRVVEQTSERIQFSHGQYDPASGVAVVTKKDYPLVFAKLVNLHKSTTDSPLFFLNIAFGIVLLFFVVSAFYMFMPRAPIFKDNMLLAAAGFAFMFAVVVWGS